MDSVALVKYKGDVGRALGEGVELIGGFGALESPLIVKPNICTSTDKTGFATTDVQIVEALIDLILTEDKNLSIKIVESDSESKFADEAFEKLGYVNLVEKYSELGFDVCLVNLSQQSTVSAEFDGLFFKNPKLPRLVVGPKYFISIAIAKTHNLTFLTGSVKNLFGLLPRKDQSHYHPYINELIVDLNRLVRPDLSIVDARVGLEGWAGPKTRRLDAFLLGRKPVSVDAVLARVMGFRPEKIRHLAEAQKYDLGSLNPEVLGTSVKYATVRFKEPKNLSPRAVARKRA